MFRNPQSLFGDDDAKPTAVSVTLRRFAGYFKPYWPQYLLVVVMMIVSTWSQVTAPALIGQAVDCYLAPGTSSALATEGSPLAALAETGSANFWNQLYATPHHRRTGLGRTLFKVSVGWCCGLLGYSSWAL